MRTILKGGVILLVVAGLLAGGATWYLRSQRPAETSYRTVEVKRGDLLATISATGTVEPEEVIDVGAQVAGQILAFGQDKNGKAIDYGSEVEEGTVLARIDPSLYAADVAQAEAQVAQAQANVQRAQADLGQMRAKLFQAQRDWERAQKLGPSEALSQNDYDAFQSANEVAKANLAVGESVVIQSQGALAQAQASLKRSQRNLSYCTIASPVKGVIIDRRVNIGQTVVASLNAPSLFLIAKDLKRMQVWVAVNEADIGSIYQGQPVSFTADAFPGEVFQGEVRKVRLNASMTQNVVTYTVEVTTDNSSGKLLPYLTANVKFEVSRHNGVLLAPNAALRWTPASEQIAPEAQAQAPRAGERRPAKSSGGQEATGTLWVPDGKYVRPVTVRVGASDGMMTEVSGDQLSEGMTIVVSEQRQESGRRGGTGAAANPFTPQMGRPRSGSSSHP